MCSVPLERWALTLGAGPWLRALGTDFGRWALGPGRWPEKVHGLRATGYGQKTALRALTLLWHACVLLPQGLLDAHASPSSSTAYSLEPSALCWALARKSPRTTGDGLRSENRAARTHASMTRVRPPAARPPWCARVPPLLLPPTA